MSVREGEYNKANLPASSFLLDLDSGVRSCADQAGG